MCFSSIGLLHNKGDNIKVNLERFATWSFSNIQLQTGHEYVGEFKDGFAMVRVLLL